MTAGKERGAEPDMTTELDSAEWPFSATVGDPDDAMAVIGLTLHLPPPYPDLVLERLSLALQQGCAIRLYARDQRTLDRARAVVEMLAAQPEWSNKCGH